MPSTLEIAQIISMYWIVSISMVYLNKVLLSNEEASIPAPLFVTWSAEWSYSKFEIIYMYIRYQCIITAFICYGFGLLGERARKGNGITFFADYPMVRYTVSSGLSVMPLSVVFVGMITFNNVCLKYVEVSFYNGKFNYYFIN